VGIIERGDDGFYVYFPDIPGCTSGGESLQDVAREAEVAVHAHLTLDLEHGGVLPPVRAMDDIPADPDVTEVARILVRFDEPGKSVRVNVTLPENLLAEADRYAAGHGFTRSGLLAQGLRELMRSA
jgi:predicted RNase H-like HicB family nuclease